MGWTRLTAVLVVAGCCITGCAAIRTREALTTEDMLAAAGFHAEHPNTAARLARLRALTPRKLVRHEEGGEVSYLYADPEACGCVYVGHQPQYLEYEKLRLQKQEADNELAASQTGGVDAFGGWHDGWPGYGW